MVRNSDDALIIDRVFDAPRALVWRAWTDPAHALRWMGPRDVPAISWSADVRPGGAWRGCLQNPRTQEELWQGGVFREVLPPELLVYTFQWDGGTETLVTVRFSEEGGRTRMHFHQAPFADAGNRDGHRGGWSSAFDRLDELLAG